jgi:hypothetical protein
MSDRPLDEKVTRYFWMTMLACALYAVAAWVLTR